MSIISIGGAPSYTISLDSLDLTYLGKYVSTPRAEKMPLWTKKRLDGESEYCQVEIITQGNNNEDLYSEATDTYQCHICNINMPKNCYQRHIESKQHETFNKINQKVLERVSKQKYVISMNTDEDIRSDSYYCEPCSNIIEIGNKDNHEATDYHAKAVKDSMIINEFYKLMNENISNEVNEELLEVESILLILNNSNDMYDTCTSMDTSNSDESDDDSDQNTILAHAPGHSTIETTNDSPKMEESEELLEEERGPFNKSNDMNVPCTTSMEASSTVEIDDDSDQNTILVPAAANSTIATINHSPKVEESEQLLEEERDPSSMEASSTVEIEDDPDQTTILAPAASNSTIATINLSPKGEESEELLEEERDPINNSHDMYVPCTTSLEASSTVEIDDDPDQTTILDPAPGDSTIETTTDSPKVEESEQLLEKERDPSSMEASSTVEIDDDSDQNTIVTPAPGNSTIATINHSPKVEESEELLEEERDPSSMEASSTVEIDDDPDQTTILAPAPGTSTIETISHSPKVEESEELLEEERDPFSMEASSTVEIDDDPDQNTILAPAPGNSNIETIKYSPKMEESEELLEEERDPFNNSHDMYVPCTTSIEASSTVQIDDDPDQTTILAPAPGDSTIETTTDSPKVEESEQLLEEERDPFSMEASSTVEIDDDSDQNTILAPAAANSTIATINHSPKVDESEELLEEERDPSSMEASSTVEIDDDPDQNTVLAPSPGNSNIESTNHSLKVEESEEILEKERDPSSMEASSTVEIDHDPDQNTILAPVPGNSNIESTNHSPKVEESEELLEEERDPINNSNDMHDSNKSDDDLIDLNSFLDLVPGSSTITITINPPPRVEEDKSFQEYLQKMIKIYNVEVSPPLSVYGEFIVLVAPNGDRVKVCRQNFHSYVVIRQHMYCQICNMGIWGTDDTSEHDITEQHVRNLFRPINNHFARRLGNTWSHCVPCNAIVVADSDLHPLKPVHKQIIDSTQIPKLEKTRCEDCSLYIDTHSFSDHLSSETHLRTLELLEQNSIHDFGNDVIFCKLCNQTLPKYALNFHVGTEPHLSRKTNSTVVSNENNDTTLNDENNASTNDTPTDDTIINDENNASTNDALTDDTIINDENNASTNDAPTDDTIINDENNASTNDAPTDDTIINDENDKSTINYENNASNINEENNALTLNGENSASTNDAPTEIIDKSDSLATGVNVTDARFCEMWKAKLPGELSSANIKDIKHSENRTDDLWGTSANTCSSYNTCRISDSVAKIIDQNDSLVTGVNVTDARFYEMWKAKLPGELSSANINDIKPSEDDLWGTSANTGSSYGTYRVSDSVAKITDQNDFLATGVNVTDARLYEMWKAKLPGELSSANINDIKPSEDDLWGTSANTGSSYGTYRVSDSVAKITDQNDFLATGVNVTDARLYEMWKAKLPGELSSANINDIKPSEDDLWGTSANTGSSYGTYRVSDSVAKITDQNDFLATGVNVTDARLYEMWKAKLPGELSSANINDIKPSEDDLWGTSATTRSSYSTYRVSDSVASTSTMSSRSNYTTATDHGYEKYDTFHKIIDFVDETRALVRCKICFFTISYSEYNLMCHMRSKNHMAILQIWEQYEKLNLANCNWYNKETMETYDKKVVRAYTKLSFISHCQLKCELCDVILSVDEKSLLAHTRGKHHVTATNYHYYRNGRKL